MEFFESAEGFVQHMQNSQQRAEMYAESFHHNLKKFLDNLSADELDLIWALARNMADDKMYAGYIIGQIVVRLDRDHKKCVCGHEHEVKLGDASLNETIPDE